MIMVRDIFRNKETTEFVIVTIPTVSAFFMGAPCTQCDLIFPHILILVLDKMLLQVMAISESSRLKSSLEKEGVPVKRLIINQVLPPSNSDCKFCAIKRKVCTVAYRQSDTSSSFFLCNVWAKGSVFP
jgi:arsenite-transporting ATPase